MSRVGHCLSVPQSVAPAADAVLEYPVRFRRLSRFLIHQTLCRYGALENGLLPPVSVAMKHEEQAYLEVYKTFSQPTRDLCKVSRHRRKQFQYSVVKEAFGFIEEGVGRALHGIGKSPID